MRSLLPRFQKGEFGENFMSVSVARSEKAYRIAVEEQVHLTVPAIQIIAKIAKQVNIFPFFLEFRANVGRRGSWRRFLSLQKSGMVLSEKEISDLVIQII